MCPCVLRWSFRSSIEYHSCSVWLAILKACASTTHSKCGKEVQILPRRWQILEFPHEIVRSMLCNAFGCLLNFENRISARETCCAPAKTSRNFVGPRRSPMSLDRKCYNDKFKITNRGEFWRPICVCTSSHRWCFINLRTAADWPTEHNSTADLSLVATSSFCFIRQIFWDR